MNRDREEREKINKIVQNVGYWSIWIINYYRSEKENMKSICFFSLYIFSLSTRSTRGGVHNNNNNQERANVCSRVKPFFDVMRMNTWKREENIFFIKLLNQTHSHHLDISLCSTLFCPINQKGSFFSSDKSFTKRIKLDMNWKENRSAF